MASTRHLPQIPSSHPFHFRSSTADLMRSRVLQAELQIYLVPQSCWGRRKRLLPELRCPAISSRMQYNRTLSHALTPTGEILLTPSTVSVPCNATGPEVPRGAHGPTRPAKTTSSARINAVLDWMLTRPSPGVGCSRIPSVDCLSLPGSLRKCSCRLPKRPRQEARQTL